MKTLYAYLISMSIVFSIVGGITLLNRYSPDLLLTVVLYSFLFFVVGMIIVGIAESIKGGTK